MMYILAIVIPPLALLIEGKIFQAIINGIFWLLGIFFVIIGGWILWAITVVHALIVIQGSRADARTRKIVDAINSKNEN